MGPVDDAADLINGAVAKVLSIVNGPHPVWTGSAADTWNDQFRQWASAWQRLDDALPAEQ